MNANVGWRTELTGSWKHGGHCSKGHLQGPSWMTSARDERSRPLSWGGTAPGTRGPRAEHEGGQARVEAARDARACGPAAMQFRRRTAVTLPESQRQGPENGRVDPAAQVTGRPFRGRWGHTHAWTSPGLDAGNGRPRRGRAAWNRGGAGTDNRGRSRTAGAATPHSARPSRDLREP